VSEQRRKGGMLAKRREKQRVKAERTGPSPEARAEHAMHHKPAESPVDPVVAQEDIQARAGLDRNFFSTG
jgi:hypothetical protein